MTRLLAVARAYARVHAMSTITEIEAAIESLPEPQVDELAAWLEKFRAWRAPPPPVEIWLSHAVGAAKPGVTTADVMALTRGEVSCRLARAVSL